MTPNYPFACAHPNTLALAMGATESKPLSHEEERSEAEKEVKLQEEFFKRNIGNIEPDKDKALEKVTLGLGK